MYMCLSVRPCVVNLKIYLSTSRHPCIPPTTPVLFHELFQTFFWENSILIFLMQKIGLFLQVLIMSRDIMLNLLWVSVNVSHWANSFQPFLLEELTSRFINLGFQFSKMLISSGQVKSWLWQAVKDILNVKAISPSILFRELSFSFSDLLDERNGKPQTPFQTFDLGQKL